MIMNPLGPPKRYVYLVRNIRSSEWGYEEYFIGLFGASKSAIIRVEKETELTRKQAVKMRNSLLENGCCAVSCKDGGGEYKIRREIVQ